MRANNVVNITKTVSQDRDSALHKLKDLKIERLELENKILKNKVQEILLKRDLNLLGSN